jgi:UPF0716 protein FxsA
VPRPEWLVMFTSRQHLLQLLSDVLVLSLFMIADGLILVHLSRETGVYLALALEGAVAIAAVIVVGSSVNKEIQALRSSARNGRYLPRRFARLAGCVVAGVLLVLPGFATDALGILIYLPPGRYLFTAIFLRRNGDRLPVVYEYLKLSVFSGDEPEASDVPGAPVR